ncbi:DUF6878 family protein [Burkholderia glumae]|uniref:DUF6878 family protein n=1 Tax=Burkholderia glumae TaxID=337 RepID=UPI0020CF5AE5|nr:DUF6878 family protein [Burkholderia glumae]MCQ0031440.1 hypothetical protein [Burkholderia glumae]MCQ0035092.1 hypothetical protein [Burkholderia glumae]MCR1769742.1 hypothetical protein [Burkholderia glumae]
MSNTNNNAVLSAIVFEHVHGSDATQYDELIANNKATLLAALATAGVRECVVSYEGFGDSGNVVDVRLTSADDAPMSALGNIDLAVQDSRYVDGAWTARVRSQTMPFSDAFSHFAHVAVYRHHPGFENNDGGSGEVYFEVDSMRVWIEHRDYYTESIYSENEL